MNELDQVLPVHSRTGLTAVGIVNGRPVWPILGGDETADAEAAARATEEKAAKAAKDAADAAAEAAAAAGDDEDKPLGPAGEKALAAEKEKRREQADKRREAEAEATRLRAEIAQLKAGGGDEAAAEAAKQAIINDANAAATKKANARVLNSEVQRVATGKLANPKLALKLLDLTKFEVDDDGNVDDDEISDAIADLIKKEPYLAAQGRRFQGDDADGGPRNRDQGKGKPPQVTEEQLKTMSPDEIVKAQKEGRLADLL
jgi:hypothetical protein